MDHVPVVLSWPRRIWLWGPAVLQMTVIFILSSQSDPLPDAIPDVVGHFAGYAILGALVTRAIAAAAWSGVTAGAAGRAWIVSAIYGVTDEYHQSFVAGRTPSAIDWIADAAGAAAAVVAIVVAARSFVGPFDNGRDRKRKT